MRVPFAIILALVLVLLPAPAAAGGLSDLAWIAGLPLRNAENAE